MLWLRPNGVDARVWLNVLWLSACVAARVAEVAERVAELCVGCCVVERAVERAFGWPCVLLVERVDRAAVRVIRRLAPGRACGSAGWLVVGWVAGYSSTRVVEGVARRCGAERVVDRAFERARGG